MAPWSVIRAMQVAKESHRAGRLAESEKIYRQVLQQEPTNHEALHLLGILSAQAGRAQGGIELIRHAIAVAPFIASYHYNLANLLLETKQLDEAITEYRHAIEFNPGFIDAMANLGHALGTQRRPDEAIEILNKALSLAPDRIDVLNNLANALRDRGFFERAIDCCYRGLTIAPTSADLHNNLGIALQNLGKIAEAIVEYRKAIELRPDFSQAHNNLAMALLMIGKYSEGFVEFEWRWKAQKFQRSRREFLEPMWDGQPLDGKSILLHAEGGIGDTLQLVRYVPLVAQRGGKVILLCQPEVARLFRDLPHLHHLVVFGNPVPPFEIHCPLMSLPLIFHTEVESIPSKIPYVKPNPDLVAEWSKKLGDKRHIRVGLAWSGNPKFNEDSARSIDPPLLEPLLRSTGIEFHSLEKSQSQHTAWPVGALAPIDHAKDLSDFADTAALTALMDLVVTTDNSRANLAGALGCPTWVMLQLMPDWRWMLQRTDSPWYPTIRLFRQATAGDWQGVVERVTQALNEFRQGALAENP